MIKWDNHVRLQQSSKLKTSKHSVNVTHCYYFWAVLLLLEGGGKQWLRRLRSWFFFCFFLFLFLFFCFLGHLWHKVVPKLRVELEPQLPAYATATAMQDLSCICNLHHSSQQHWILNALSEARDWTHILMDTSRGCFYWATTGTPKKIYLSQIDIRQINKRKTNLITFVQGSHKNMRPKGS